MDKEQVMQELQQRTEEGIEDTNTDASTNAPGLNTPEGMQMAVAKLRVKTTKTGKIPGVDTEEDKERRKLNRRLTPNMELFVNHLLSGDPAPEAYKKAYNVRSTNHASIVATANKIMRDPRIVSMLEALSGEYRRKVIENAVTTREHVMSELFKHAQQAKQEGTKLKALELMGRAVGMFTDKVEQKVEEISTEKLKAELKSHLSLLDNVKPIKKHSA